MKKSTWFISAAIFVALAFVLSCSGDGSSDDGAGLSSSVVSESSSSMQEWQSSSSSKVIFNSPVRAMPVPASSSGEPEILYSYKEGNKNHYVIYAGHIEKAFVSEIGIVHYIGIPMKFSKTTTTSNTLITSITKTVSSSIVAQNTSAIEISLDAALKKRLPVANFFVGFQFDGAFTNSVTTTNSTKTELTTIESRTESESSKLSFEIGKNNEALGHYRYALFAAIDVYFVISTDLDNEKLISQDIVFCVREGTYVPWWEYSPDGTFDNSPVGNKIEFADDFYTRLPRPTVEIKSETKVFTINDNENPYIFDKGFPATVEVYALGAGGGGQGGHKYSELFRNYNGTGGGGGGGAVAYVKFIATGPIAFDTIKIGKGGKGSSGIADAGGWGFNASASTGGDGDETKVVWEGKTVTVKGGNGGGGAGKSLDGGKGGAASSIPLGVDEFISRAGGSGGAGDKTAQKADNGGKVEKLNLGSLGSFGGSSAGVGGNGGYGNNVGSDGGDGLVIILFTYPERN
jgi:hypothetical protein